VTPTPFADRLARLRAAIADRGVDGVLVGYPANVRYLSGFTGSSGWLLITQDAARLVSDFRFRLQAADEAPDFEFVEIKRTDEDLPAALAALGCAAVGFEAEHLTVQTHQRLAARLPDLRLEATTDLVESLRMIKDESELALLERAATLTDAALRHGLALLAPGIAERELAAEIEGFIRRAGGEVSFDRTGDVTIVAAGPRGALPHARPTDHAVKSGEAVVFDLGAKVGGYTADLTRTVVVGEASQRQREIYALCLEAQQAGLEAVRPGAVAQEVDAAARGVIERAGLGDLFGHGLGHGVGLEVHEAPRLARGETRVLEPGMVVTVEPGVYLPGEFGVRIEDTVAVTPQGRRALTRSAKPEKIPAL
jgi:Xaa-Pro aminopeptidase